MNDIILPEEVTSLLFTNNLILAGGSVVDIMCGRRNVNDYDLFCIGSRPKSFHEDTWIESKNCLTTLSKPKIQVIKRIYDNPGQVIGKKKI